MASVSSRSSVNTVHQIRLMGAAHTSKVTEKMERSDPSREQRNEMQGHASSSARPLSIEAPSSDSSSSVLEPMPNQPRQPTSLQGVLRFAMEANDGQNLQPSAFQQMDEKEKEFLRKTLSSLTGNVIAELQEAIKTLSNVGDLRPEDDISEQEAALEKIADYVDNMDIANDFYKIGGFSIFGPCLNSPHSSIRWRAADVIAELAQNNPFCQERCLQAGLFPMLLNMIDADPAETARIKALYAISCIVREHPISLNYMQVNDGYSVLLRAMQSSVKKLQIKSAFLLSSLCNKDDAKNLKLCLVNMGLVEQVAGLLATADQVPEIRDQLLNILSGLTNDDFQPALRECQRPELCLRATLECCIQDLQKEDNPDQVEVCRRLLDTIFTDRDTNSER